MLPITIDRYILSELLKLFILSVGALTFLMFLDKFLFIAELIVNRGVTFFEILKILAFISPAILALTIPMSVLVASVAAFNQFSTYNEFIAMKASTWSYLQLMRPVVYFSLIAYLLANLVMFLALPWGNLSYKKLIYNIIQNRADLDIKPNVFNKDFDKLIFLVKDRNDTQMGGIFLADMSNTEVSKVITAREGFIMPNRETLKIQLQLKNGTIHELRKSRSEYQTLNFDRYDLTLNLPAAERLKEEALVGNRELSLKQNLERIEELKKKGLPLNGPQVELSKKFSIPFTCLLFGLMGAPLGIHSRRSGKSGGFALCIMVILIYYIGLISTQNLGRLGEINPYLSVWIPNFVFLGVAGYFTYKMEKDIPFKFSDWIGNRIFMIWEKLRKTIQAVSSQSRPQTAGPFRPSVKQTRSHDLRDLRKNVASKARSGKTDTPRVRPTLK
ncbi:MAG: hypothetical protein COV67_07525 [Nitrospinae bacterium CG11_big_fil_rev_8_21_14_0_20_56_8]|nr:MAG: hypothetical protein COV67_07525 [Nitrospinae bacterium CG11_big_fil_rev_8_21_14_0_20_56_8]